MSEQQPARRRWHDNRGELSRAIELLEVIPSNITQYILDALLARTEQEFNTSEILKSFKSLGKEQILKLYQAKNKRRGYDQDPHLHQIVNTFLILPEGSKESVAADFLQFTSLIVDYIATCETFDIEAKPDDLEQIRHNYVYEGLTAAKAYLEKIQAPYEAKLRAENPMPQKAHITLAQDRQGELKLRPSFRNEA